MKPLQSWHPELPAPAHLTRASKEIAAAWESFINDGTVVGPAPRPVVLEGWMRCREQGSNPHAERAPTALSPEELQSILHSDELGRAGKSILDRFQKVMGGIGHVAILADAHGRILYEVGHPEMQARLSDINLTTGALWSEQMVGLNGVGRRSPSDALSSCSVMSTTAGAGSLGFVTAARCVIQIRAA